MFLRKAVALGAADCLLAPALGAHFELVGRLQEDSKPKPLVRFGIVTDLHYASRDSDPIPQGVAGRRCYRESLRKLAEAIAVFNRQRLDFVVELGDFKDLSSDRKETLVRLEEIEASFARFKGPRYHVFGNHDFDCLTPADLASCLTNDGCPMSEGYYRFQCKGVTFLVLDCCYDSNLRHYSCCNPWDDANVPPHEVAWLRQMLADATGFVVVLTHQRIDPSAEPGHLVRNAAEVRKVLEESGKVALVLSGHQHMGGFNVYRGITYYSLVALVADSGPLANSFAEVAIYLDGTFSMTGYRNALSYGAEKGVV